jgi:mannose-6-phosphate isomerase-like protein (cupin superfamily)
MKVIKLNDLVEFNSEKLKKISLFDTKNFFCDLYCLEPGQSQKIHSHSDSDKVYYILKGRGRVTIGSDEKELGPDEITLAPAGEDHGVVNHTRDKLLMLVFMAPKP